MIEHLPDNTAARVALWRAMHVLLDDPPHVLEDEIGLELLAPAPGWRERADMDPVRTARNRASIVARARVVEDEVLDRSTSGLTQYVVLGAGLDTFVQRRPDVGSLLRVFEVDQPETQAWKQRRLIEAGREPPEWLRFVPVDFEAGESWRAELEDAGFDGEEPALVSSLGVVVYLTNAAIDATMREVAELAPGSSLVMSFMIPIADVDADEQGALQGAAKGASAGGTPWISFFEPDEIVSLARAAGFAEVRHVTPDDLADRYFAGRADGLRPSSAEHLIVATT